MELKPPKSLTLEFGKGFGKTSLYQFYSFYKSYPNIFQTSGKSYLEWSKYALLITVLDPKAREWYENECLAERWSVRVLQRNIESQYYFRLVKPGEPIKKEDYPAVSYEESKEVRQEPDGLRIPRNPARSQNPRGQAVGCLLQLDRLAFAQSA